jgi:hypothetical protein
LLADDFEVEFELRSKKAKTKEVIKKDAIKQGKSERRSPAQRYNMLHIQYTDLNTGP